MSLPANAQIGWSSTDHWSPAERATRGMTLREAARKAGIKYVAGFERCYLDGEPTTYAKAREVIGQRLLREGP